MSRNTFVGKVLSTCVLALLASCAMRPQVSSLDYDSVILLDAEELAEGGIGKAYEQLLPELRRFVAEPWVVEDVVHENAPRYAIRANGFEYLIYSTDTPTDDESPWDTASFVFFKIVNDQLTGTAVKFYALMGGNELAGVFLSPGEMKAARASLSNPRDWPYLPEPEPHWHGHPH